MKTRKANRKDFVPNVKLYRVDVHEDEVADYTVGYWCHRKQVCLVKARLDGLRLVRDIVNWYWLNYTVQCCGCGKSINFRRQRVRK